MPGRILLMETPWARHDRIWAFSTQFYLHLYESAQLNNKRRRYERHALLRARARRHRVRRDPNRDIRALVLGLNPAQAPIFTQDPALARQQSRPLNLGPALGPAPALGFGLIPHLDLSPLNSLQ